MRERPRRGSRLKFSTSKGRRLSTSFRESFQVPLRANAYRRRPDTPTPVAVPRPATKDSTRTRRHKIPGRSTSRRALFLLRPLRRHTRPVRSIGPNMTEVVFGATKEEGGDRGRKGRQRRKGETGLRDVRRPLLGRRTEDGGIWRQEGCREGASTGGRPVWTRVRGLDGRVCPQGRSASRRGTRVPQDPSSQKGRQLVLVRFREGRSDDTKGWKVGPSFS